MKKSCAVKTASHQPPKHSAGQVSYKAETKYVSPFRRNTIASGVTNRVDSFEEMTKEIALSMKVPNDPVQNGPKVNGFSYNICRSISEDKNDACLNMSKVRHGSPSVLESSIREVKTSDTRNMFTKGKPPAPMRRVSLAAGNRRSSATVSADHVESPATGGRRHKESIHVSRWQQTMKRRNSQGLDKFKPTTGATSNERTVKHDTKGHLSGCKSPVNCRLNTEQKMNNGNYNHIKPDDTVPVDPAETRRNNEKRRNGKDPLVKTSHSDSSIQSNLEYSSLEGHHFQNKTYTNDKTVSQIARPEVETDLMVQANGMGRSKSPGCSRVSSGSRKSSVSQRSLLSMTSTASAGSLAERIIEARVLINSFDSNDSLPVNVPPRSVSLNFEESGESTKGLVYSKRTGVAVSDSHVDKHGPSHDVHGAQGGSVSLSDVRKHLPDMAPKDGENSVPIRHIYRRKQRRMILEA